MRDTDCWEVESMDNDCCSRQSIVVDKVNEDTTGSC